MQWDVEPMAAKMNQMASDLSARIDALDPESDSPIFSDFSFAITTGDWTLTNGLYTARVNNAVLLTATAGIQIFYDSSIRTALVGDIYEDKHTGYIDFYTTEEPTGSITGIVRVIDSTGGNVQVSRGGTGASTPKGARSNLNTPIRDIPVNFGIVSSLPQTVYDADLTEDMVAFDAVFGNPEAIPTGIDITFAAGSVTITGTLKSGQETTISFWAHEKRSVVEGTESGGSEQRVTDFVQVTSQTLTAIQQAQARANIGAASDADLTTLNSNFSTVSTRVNDLRSMVQFIEWNGSNSKTFSGVKNYTILFVGFLQGTGNILLLFEKTGTSLNVKNVLTNTTFSSNYVTFTLSGNNIVFATNQTSYSKGVLIILKM